MASTAARSRRTLNVWPGYVDALATLLLSVVFLLTVFVVGQFFLSQELTGRDETLAKLNRQIADLTDLLALERSNRRTQEDEVRNLRTTLAGVEAERDQAKTQAEAATVSQGAAGALDKQLEAERGATKRALSQIDLLNEQISAMRRQLAALEDALAASESRDRESQARIAELGSRLNVALAQKVQELARYRSDFFGRLRQILGNRPDIRVVGDRFVLQSEVLFPAGSATLKPEAGPELDRIAGAIAALANRSRPTCPGSCGSMAIPMRGRSTRRNSRRIGRSRPPAPSRWCSIWRGRGSRPSISWLAPSANSSRSTPAPPRRLTLGTGESR